MRYLSVCSGIEAASVAWHPLGWETAAFSEIEAFPRAVLQHRFPDVPLHGDFTTIGADEYGPIDLLVGGTPCQSFSIAGLRGGLADDRGNLALEFLRLAQRTRPRWLVWENVPGVLSSNGGRDFGSILGGMVELRYGIAYRVLDAQFFGVPQRRRRVFVVGHLGDWRRAAAVLFERHSLSGHPAPRREAREGIAGIAPGGLDGGECARALTACHTATGRLDPNEQTFIGHSLRGEGFDASEDGTGRGTPLVPVAFDTTQITSAANYSNPKVGDPCHPLAAGAQQPHPSGGRAQQESHANAGVMPAVAFMENQQGAVWESDVAQALNKGGGKLGQGYPAIRVGDDYAGAYEADAASALRTLRQKVGEEAVTEWGLRILGALQSPEILRSWLHGRSLRDEAEAFRRWVDDRPLPREKGPGAITLRKLWEQGPDGRAPQGRGLAKQLAFQLGQTLPELPPKGASGGARSAVRRLTPRECEALQGFPSDYTQIPWRGKSAAECPDGPRYKALGNSMAVPVMAWIGERIAKVEALSEQHRRAA